MIGLIVLGKEYYIASCPGIDNYIASYPLKYYHTVNTTVWGKGYYIANLRGEYYYIASCPGIDNYIARYALTCHHITNCLGESYYVANLRGKYYYIASCP